MILPPGPGWGTYLDIVEAMRADPLSGDRDVLLREQFERQRPREIYETWRAQLKTGPGSPIFRAYLDLVVACRPQQLEGRTEAEAAVLAAFPDVPLLKYRAALCGGEQAPARLGEVRDRTAEFVDADLELGRIALHNRMPPDVDEGFRRLRSARTAFPASPVMPTIMGDFHQVREEWIEALEMYDAVIDLVPSHRDAWLGRTISLSHLSRHEDAIAGATRLIDLGNWFIGQAHYWRAWNEYHLDRIDAARADADRAKALMVNPPTFVLSGMIEWRQQRLESAESEFQRALDMDFGQCDAAFYLGGVRADRRKWPESLAAFQHAQQCFELSIVTRREAIAKLADTPAAASANAREIALHERAIGEAEKRRGEAAQNVAAIQKMLAGLPR
jgi:tetratricopeptide (TPR) repeat protein